MSGNPLAMAAGLAMLDAIAADEALYDRLETLRTRRWKTACGRRTRAARLSLRAGRLDVDAVLHAAGR